MKLLLKVALTVIDCVKSLSTFTVAGEVTAMVNGGPTIWLLVLVDSEKPPTVTLAPKPILVMPVPTVTVKLTCVEPDTLAVG